MTSKQKTQRLKDIKAAHKRLIDKRTKAILENKDDEEMEIPDLLDDMGIILVKERKVKRNGN
jgi:hypothetical protein